MNREIKFISRYPSGHYTGKDGQISNKWGFNEHGYYHHNGIPSSDHIHCQYTGLKDKNGKEIYEGDIIKDSEEPFIVRFGECTFLDCRFQAWYLEHIPDTGFWKHEPIDLDDLPVFEVIGNIYEHSHLSNLQQ